MNEDQRLRRLLARLPAGKGTLLGPGDDCAVVRPPAAGFDLLLKTDCVVEGAHYRASEKPERVGWKALCRALSDIAAMGGRPVSALVTIFSPPDRAPGYWEAVYRGLAKAARRYEVGIVGGEMSRCPTAAISVCVTGEIRAGLAVTRSGGKPGDRIFVTGRLGGTLERHHLDFQPRLAEGQWLARRKWAQAMMDLSDGLAADLPRLARASGCGFQLEEKALPRRAGVSIRQALADGEDYELLFAVTPKRTEALRAAWRRQFPRTLLTEIGSLIRTDQKSTPLPPGFDHFLIAKD